MTRFENICLIVSVLLVSGCVSLDSQVIQDGDASDQKSLGEQPSFSEMVSRAEETTYHVEYTYEGTGPAIYAGEPELFSNSEVRRLWRPAEDSEFSNNLYYKDSLKISCPDRENRRAECSLNPADEVPSVDLYSYRIDDLNITKKGLKTHIGRDCYLYRLKGEDFTRSYVDMCLDSQKGFLSYMSMESNSSDRIIQDMQATTVDSDVSDEDVSLPIKAIPEISCGDEELKLTTTDYSGEVKFSINDAENRTVEIGEWSSKTLEIIQTISEGKYEVKAYANGAFETDSCRKYSWQ